MKGTELEKRMIKNTFFATPIYYEERPEWLKEINEACEPYLEDTKKVFEKTIKEKKTDYGLVYHSTEIASDPALQNFYKYVGQKSADILLDMGYDLSNFTLHFSQMWVQEFPKDGGGKHSAHIHPNNHVSGFYFLETKGSFPIFYDPRTRLEMVSLPRKNTDEITMSSPFVSWNIKPGTLVLLPAYMMHEYIPQQKEPFKFIHFNVKAIEKKFNKSDRVQ
jgi:uncharacterized protein (TIGR02466 family)|tara:strand:+ start:62 stop:721 length:660 start_codon:yes stop_codon:yes gene_type:complete